jgi:hypothetical protein
LGDRVVDGKIILKLTIKKQSMRMWTRFIWLRIRVQWHVVANTVMNIRVPWKAENLTRWVTISFLRRILFEGVSYLATRSVLVRSTVILYLRYFKGAYKHTCYWLVVFSESITLSKEPQNGKLKKKNCVSYAQEVGHWEDFEPRPPGLESGMLWAVCRFKKHLKSPRHWTASARC